MPVKTERILAPRNDLVPHSAETDEYVDSEEDGRFEWVKIVRSP